MKKKTGQTQVELTKNPEDKGPFRKKQQKAIGSGREVKKEDMTSELFKQEDAQKCGKKRLSWKRRFS